MYLCVIFLLSAFAIIEVFNKEIIDRYRMVFIIACFSILVFQDGFRWETGTDWEPYYNFFTRLTVSSQYEEETFDLGYVLFNYAIRVFTESYTVFLVIFALLFYSAMFFLVFKLSSYPFVSLLIFYMTTVYYLGMNRQFMAMMFYAVGLVFLVKSNKRVFLLMVLLGAFFHKTILIGLCAMFLNKRWNSLVVISIIALTLAIASSGIINRLPLGIFALLGDQAGDKMEYYSLNHDETSMISMLFATIRRLIWIVPLMVFDKKIPNKPQGYNLMFNLYFIGTVFYLLCNGTILQIVVSRALIYFNIMEIFLVPVFLTLLKPNYGKLLVMFLLTGYVTFYVYRGFASYGEGTDYFVPYKGIFINTDYNRQYTK